VTQLQMASGTDGPDYRGKRLDRSLGEFRSAVDLLAADTVPETYWRRVQQGQRPVIGPLRLLICGSRDWTDAGLLAATVDRVAAERGHGRAGLVVIEGGARGADRLAGELARARGWQLEEYPADWQRHGRLAGIRRNARMLDRGRPEQVLAFTDDLTRSRGTADMVRRARAASLPVLVVGHELGKEVAPSTPDRPAVEQLPFL